jgi:hypothetical protein
MLESAEAGLTDIGPAQDTANHDRANANITVARADLDIKISLSVCGWARKT